MSVNTQRKNRLSPCLRAISGLRTRQSTHCHGLLLTCLLFFNPSWAQVQPEDYVPPPDPVNDYYEAIERIETEGGAYASELSDLYQGLGQSLLESQEYEAARDAFHRGVLNLRVNSGPFSLEQTNYLFSIADIESRTGDWKAAAKVLNTVYLINARNYGEDHANMLPVLEQMYEWYMRERPLYSPLAKYDDFQKAQYLAGRMAELSEREKGLSHPDTARSYRALGQIHFLTVRYVLSKGISIEPGLVMATGKLYSPNAEQVSVMEHFRDGRDAFTNFVRSVEENEESTPVEFAEALAQMGDWYLVFEKYQTARDFYQQAYQVLAESEGSNQLADAYLGKPTPLRFLNNHEDFTTDEREHDATMSLEVSMTVTRGGDLRYIEILNAPENLSEDQLWEIKEQLKTTRFRPGLINGVAVSVTDFIWHQSFEPLEKRP